MRTWMILLFALMLFGVACGGNSAEPSIETSAEEIDVAALAQTIDVHTAAALQGRDDVVLIDVREQDEYDAGHIPDITLIPMSEIQSRVSEIPTDVEVVLTCRSGNRSGQVHAYLTELGFDNVHNMDGGILAWESAGYDVER